MRCAVRGNEARGWVLDWGLEVVRAYTICIMESIHHHTEQDMTSLRIEVEGLFILRQLGERFGEAFTRLDVYMQSCGLVRSSTCYHRC